MEMNITQACDICSKWTGLSVDYFSLHQNVSILRPILSSGGPRLLLHRPPALEVWGIGLLFVTMICTCSVVGIAVMPLLSKRVYDWAIIYFIGLGVGSLSGSAAFNLLPKAFGLAHYDSELMFLFKSMMCIAGIYMFFFVDKILTITMELKKIKKKKVEELARLEQERDDLAMHKLLNHGSQTAKRNGVIESPSKSIPLPQIYNTIATEHNTLLVPTGNSHRLRKRSHGDGSIGTWDDDDYLYANDTRRSSLYFSTHSNLAHDLEILRKEHEAGAQLIAPVAWMIIFGDGLHKFVDGLSIGASFSRSIGEGISLSLAVACEEFPHELGDVAILLSAGMTVKQALGYNLLSACGMFCGFIVGVILGNFDERFAAYIFALAGGMFLYIALASMVPEMNETMEEEMEIKLSRGLLVVLLQTAGVFTGLVAMFVMQFYGNKLQELFY